MIITIFKQLSLLAIIISFFLGTAETQQLTDNILFIDNNIQVIINDTEILIQLNCKAKIGQCFYQYQYLPTGWTAQGNKLVLPISEINKIRSYSAQVNISESTGRWVVKSLLFHNQFGKIELTSSTLYSNQIRQRFHRQLPQNKNQFQNVTNNRQLNNRFQFLEDDKLPKINNLKNAVQNKESSVLTVEIQRIINYPLSLPAFSHPCPNNFYTLLKQDLYPILENYAHKYQNEKQQHKSNIKDLQSELRKLKMQQQRLEQQSVVEMQEQKTQLYIQYGEFQGRKNRAFSAYYSSDIIAGKYKQKMEELMPVAGYQDTYDQIQLIRAQINKDEQRLQQIEDQLRALSVEKNMINKRVSIDKKRVQVLEKNKSKPVDKKRLQSLEKSYMYYTNEAIKNKQIFEQSQKKLRELKVEIQKLDQDIKNILQNKKQLKQQIMNVQMNLKKTNTDLKQMQNFIINLNLNKNKIQNQILQCQAFRDDHQVSDEPNPQQLTSSSISTPILQSSNTISNLRPIQSTFSSISSQPTFSSIPSQPTFTSIPSQPAIMQTPTQPASSLTFMQNFRQNYNLLQTKPLNLYSSKWIIQYGVPRPVVFYCPRQLSSNEYQSGYGRILSINDNGFRILRQQGDTILLFFSLCSKIMIFNSLDIPSIGDIIEWNGKMRRNGQYYLYSGTIYQSR